MSTNINFNKLLGFKNGCNIMLANLATQLLLDLYPNASVAYSLRKLRTAYTGSAIRVRRSVDNAEQDFGFAGNNLDTASLLTFCGVGNGFVTTWYDQSGNGNNATQATAAHQARIVSSGNLIFVNNKVAAQFTNDFYNLSAGVTPASRFITANVIERPTGGRFTTWGNRNSNSRPHLFSWDTDNNINCGPYSLGQIRTITNSSYGGQSIVTTKRIAGNVIQGSLNGVQYTPLSLQSNQSAVVILGGVNSTQASSGYLQETIWWNQNYSSLELDISDKINEYYGIY